MTKSTDCVGAEFWAGNFSARYPASAISPSRKNMTKSNRETNRLSAVDNEGERYIIVELARPRFRRDGRLVLLNGEKVNRRSDGIFQIVETGKILRKVG
jgi:hypothetical protein